ncbi:hypothetical protein ElyMa_002042800 [Elysia marginata]|uniref:Uncharacterized protein n=1 Tax=Elysia marginata TaxID=1093978 RepID=A0AAV4F8Z6_9GAST|nr:hypothetical protein ElyMa_002042800 [Elysia marginata]
MQPSTLHPQRPARLPFIFWKRVSHISDFLTLLSVTTLRHSHLKNSSHGDQPPVHPRPSVQASPRQRHPWQTPHGLGNPRRSSRQWEIPLDDEPLIACRPGTFSWVGRCYVSCAVQPNWQLQPPPSPWLLLMITKINGPPVRCLHEEVDFVLTL